MESAEVFSYVLLPDVADGDRPVLGVHERLTEETLCQKDAFRVVPQRTMTKVGNVSL
jgi:hypothetical protein